MPNCRRRARAPGSDGVTALWSGQSMSRSAQRPVAACPTRVVHAEEAGCPRGSCGSFFRRHGRRHPGVCLLGAIAASAARAGWRRACRGTRRAQAPGGTATAVAGVPCGGLPAPAQHPARPVGEEGRAVVGPGRSGRPWWAVSRPRLQARITAASQGPHATSPSACRIPGIRVADRGVRTDTAPRPQPRTPGQQVQNAGGRPGAAGVAPRPGGARAGTGRRDRSRPRECLIGKVARENWADRPWRCGAALVSTRAEGGWIAPSSSAAVGRRRRCARWHASTTRPRRW